MAKHSWNSLANYLSVHEKTLRFYHKFMEVPKSYTYSIITEFEHNLNCSGILIRTYRGNRIRMDIRKVIEIDLSHPHRPRARTFDYTYSANIASGPKLFRYCSPHDSFENEGSAPHHSHHHKHDFTKGKEEITLIGDDD